MDDLIPYLIGAAVGLVLSAGTFGWAVCIGSTRRKRAGR